MKSKIEKYIETEAEKWDNRNNVETDYYCPASFKAGANLLLPMLLECLGALQQYYPLAAYDIYNDEFNVFVAKQTLDKINKQVGGL